MKGLFIKVSLVPKGIGQFLGLEAARPITTSMPKGLPNEPNHTKDRGQAATVIDHKNQPPRTESSGERREEWT